MQAYCLKALIVRLYYLLNIQWHSV